ncbi:MAG TPA: formimidoylglutamate deiminase [Acidimicrobiales bacterium]|jgi:formiminoglutamate deiminase
MTAYWCELAWLGGDEPEPSVLIELDGDRIASITSGTAAPGAVRLEGLTIPGLVNAHSHAFHRALRGRAEEGHGSFWTWRDQMYAVAARLDPNSYLALARAVYAEMALTGITTVGEFHYLHDGASTMGDALLLAARRAGIRITLLDACYLHGGIGEDRAGVQRRFGDPDVHAWVRRVSARSLDNHHARLGAAIHSIRAVTPEEAATVAAWAKQNEVVLHAHVSEQPAENEASEAAYNRSPMAVLADAGAITERFCAVHATHVSEADQALLGAARSFVCVCPTTERDLGDGIGPAAGLTAAGARLCVGSDSHAVIDLFEEARGVELDERLRSGERGHHSARALLRAATGEGAAALGWHDTGFLAPGARADLTTIRLGSARLAGTRPVDAVAALVFAATAADVSHVVAGGRPIVSNGRHLLVDDVPGALAGAIAAVT